MADFSKWLRVVVRGQWDRLAAWVALGVGALALLLGWLGVSRTPYTAEQIPYVVSAGIGGVFLLGLGAMLWLSADLRDEWRKLDRLERALEGRPPTDPSRGGGEESPDGGAAPGEAPPEEAGAPRSSRAGR